MQVRENLDLDDILTCNIHKIRCDHPVDIIRKQTRFIITVYYIKIHVMAQSIQTYIIGLEIESRTQIIYGHKPAWHYYNVLCSTHRMKQYGILTYSKKLCYVYTLYGELKLRKNNGMCLHMELCFSSVNGVGGVIIVRYSFFL